jgi:hypothetical protein
MARFQDFTNQIDQICIHHFGAVWASINVAVYAGLVAQIPQVDLKRAQMLTR